eukprot:960199_1
MLPSVNARNTLPIGRDGCQSSVIMRRLRGITGQDATWLCFGMKSLWIVFLLNRIAFNTPNVFAALNAVQKGEIRCHFGSFCSCLWFVCRCWRQIGNHRRST